MEPIGNMLMAESIIALVTRFNRRAEKELGCQSCIHFLSRLLFRIENIERYTTKILKILRTQSVGIVIAADIAPRLLLTQLQLDDYSIGSSLR